MIESSAAAYHTDWEQSTLEAGFFPGAVYLLSTWYSRYDIQKRYTAFYAIGCVATAFSGILAYGLMHMNGLGNLEGWRWIFIIEGIISVLVSLLSYLLLVDFPEEAHKSWKFLSKDERDFVIRRVNRDRADAITDPFTVGAFFRPALDLKIWVFAFMFFCVTLVGYSINYYLPIILLGMGTNCLRPALFLCSPIRKRSSKLQRLCFLEQDSTDSTHRLLDRPGSMSHCSTLGIYGAHDVRSSMVQRQIPSARPRHCHERGASSHQPSFDRIFHQQSISILWSLLRHSRLERQHPSGPNLPGKQHPRKLETRVLQRNPCWVRWYWRNRRGPGL